MATFSDRVLKLPHLGIGVSTEYGAGEGAGALDVLELRRRHPEYASFLEIGVETSKGLDGPALAWVEQGWPTTYHFLDVNLDEPEDFDRAWLEEVRRTAARIRPAWMCGDAGLWHFGRRERGHMLLLPPALSRDSAEALAEGICRLREQTGSEVLPENPPGQVYLGDLHLLDFYALVCERADTGLLLDCAHLGIYQRVKGYAPLTGLDGFPMERVVEMHVAGGTLKRHEGFEFVEDDHIPGVLPETWQIFEAAAARAVHLRAVVFECERNPMARSLPGFERIEKVLSTSPWVQGARSLAGVQGAAPPAGVRGGAPIA
jgi:uncharacterized protein (UPF0276 family)